MALPKRRLKHIAELQWELDAWLRHMIEWGSVIGRDSETDAQIEAMEKSSQLLFFVFGQPAAEYKEE